MKPETIERIRRFTSDREWEQYHTPANLAKSISIEANELLECFQWSETDFDINHIKEETETIGRQSYGQSNHRNRSARAFSGRSN